MRYEEMHNGIKWVCIFNTSPFNDTVDIDMFAVSNNCIPLSSVCHAPDILAFKCRAIHSIAIELQNTVKKA